LSAGDKPNIFMKNESAEVVSMQSFVQPEGSMKACIIAKQKFKFIFDADIIETLIFGLLLSNSEEEGDEDYSFEQAKKNALKHFAHNQEDDIFVFEVKSVLNLNKITNFVSFGVSFRQASRLYQSVKEETRIGVKLAPHCRILCAVNLQYLKEIFKNVWAFAISSDAGNNARTAYLDFCM